MCFLYFKLIECSPEELDKNAGCRMWKIKLTKTRERVKLVAATLAPAMIMKITNDEMIDRSNCRIPCHSMTTSFTCVGVL